MLEFNTIGADPEVFVEYKLKSEITPVVGLLGGTKENPIKSELYNNIMLQEDNVLAEFNIPPSNALNKFHENILKGLAAVEHGVGRKYRVRIIPYHEFDLKVLKKSGDQALLFGCDPDFNAYTMLQNPDPVADNKGFRSASGHVHVGFKEVPDDPFVLSEFVQALDITLGLRSVVYDEDRKRRILYGKAGAFRIKPYGVEYRVLSNFWLSNGRYVKYVYDGVLEAFEIFNNNIKEAHNKVPANEIQRIINEYDEVAAIVAIKKLGIEL